MVASRRASVANHAGQDKKRRATDGRGDVRRIRPHALRGRSVERWGGTPTTAATAGGGPCRMRQDRLPAGPTGHCRRVSGERTRRPRTRLNRGAGDHPTALRVGRGRLAGPASHADAFAGLGEMYVSDPRFAKHYDRHGPGTAEFVRDAMLAFAVALVGAPRPCAFSVVRAPERRTGDGVAYPVFVTAQTRPAVRRSVRPHHRRIRILRTDDRRKGRDAAR